LSSEKDAAMEGLKDSIKAKKIKIENWSKKYKLQGDQLSIII
jgi:hypothetical protein